MITGPDGKSYTTLAAAQTANGYLTDSTVSTNKFIITLSASTQTGTVSFGYTSNVPGQNGVAGNTPPALPSNISLSGLTGAPFTFAVPSVPAGYTITSVVAPDTKTYTSFTSALTANPNYIVGTNNFKATISAQTQTGKVSFKYVVGTPGTDTSGNLVTDSNGKPTAVTSSTAGTVGLANALPASISLSGLTNAAIPTDLSIPSNAYPGYSVDHVVGPNGTSYSTVALATAANPWYSATSNNFTVYLKAQTNTATVKFQADTSSGNSIPSATLTNYGFVFAQGLTGAPISLSLLSAPGTGSGSSAGAGWGTPSANSIDQYITNTLVANLNTSLGFTGKPGAAGWAVSGVYDLASTLHTPSSGLCGFVSALNASTYYFKTSGTSEFDVLLGYSGSLDMAVPTAVDFGNNTIVGTAKTYTGALKGGGVIVTDNRANSQLSPWTISVGEDPTWGSTGNNGIQEAVQTGTDSNGNPIWMPTGGVSFEGKLMYKGTVLSGSSSVNVMTNNTPTTGSTTVIAGNATPFTLNVPVNLQKPNTSFVGKIQWTLTTAP